MEVKFKASPSAREFVYHSQEAAGADISLATNLPAVIQPGMMGTVGTGVSVAIPKGYFGMISLRSSIGKRGLLMPNAPGIIDSDYRGEIIIMMLNMTTKTIQFEPGERIAQMILLPYEKMEFIKVDKLPDTERGEGGFGSTGK